MKVLILVFLVAICWVQSIQLSDPDCVCPTNLQDDHCRDKNFPVLGGVDFVNYFTLFKLPDGSYNESAVGIVGSSVYQASFNGYKFYFVSQANLDIFNACPTCYIPQYGGFCTWGVTGEFCPKYAWSSSCLGPPGAWNSWTIYKEKLYFFLSADPKALFMADPATFVSTGDARWYEWFGDQYQSQFDTKCYKTFNKSKLSE